VYFREGEESGQEEDGVVSAEFVLLLRDELVEVVVCFLSGGRRTVSDPSRIFFFVSLTISARRAF
jgi:hypothetical protein